MSRNSSSKNCSVAFEDGMSFGASLRLACLSLLLVARAESLKSFEPHEYSFTTNDFPTLKLQAAPHEMGSRVHHGHVTPGEFTTPDDAETSNVLKEPKPKPKPKPDIPGRHHSHGSLHHHAVPLPWAITGDARPKAAEASPPGSGYHGNGTKCWVSRIHRGCSCTRFHDNFSINCSNAGLSTVPKKWTDIGDFITTLNLERNRIKEINEGDFYGVKIRRLLLANNSLTDLKLLAFWGLTTSLETLDLSYNKLRVVPSESAKLLINLKTLVLTGNEIDHLGAHDIGFWKKLEVLTLDNNPILSIHSSCIAGTKSLSFLSLDNLKLTNKIHDIAQMETSNIKGLSLTRNGINVLPARWSRNFTSLTLLNLGHNDLADINQEEAFHGLHNTLKNLDLHRNRINKVPILALRRLVKLNILDLSGNKVSRIKKRSFIESKNLQLIDLSHNRISKISKKAFVGLDSIQRLDLRFNRLVTLDDRVFGWNFASPKFVPGKQVFLGGNPWLCNCVLNWLRESVKRGKSFGSHANKERSKRGKQDKRNFVVSTNKNNININSNNNMEMSVPSDGMNIFADDPQCERPSFLKGTPLSLLNEEDLTCNHDYYYYEDDELTTQTATTVGPTSALSHEVSSVDESPMVDDELTSP